MNWQKDEFHITDDKQKLDIIYIHHWLSTQSYWAQNIQLQIVQKCIKGSICFGVFKAEKQIGFARVITDNATFGYLADVFIDEAYQGLKLSKWLLTTILAHPELQGFRSWQLATRDAQGLYAQFGFEPLKNPERIMRKTNLDGYQI